MGVKNMDRYKHYQKPVWNKLSFIPYRSETAVYDTVMTGPTTH